LGRILVPFGRVSFWLDAWALQSYGEDTRAWAAKMEKFRALKVTERQTQRSAAGAEAENAAPDRPQ